MIYRLTVPGPIEDVEEVRVLEWHGGAGHSFASGELVVELETHKALVEVRAGQPGVLRSVVCEAGGWCAIGETLGLLSDTPDEAMPTSPAESGEWLVAFEIT